MFPLLAIQLPIAIQVALTVASVAVFALGAVYAERKVSAFIQDRLGPMEAGPYGAIQTLADVLKLVLKEPIIPKAADKPLFILAPPVIFVAVFAGIGALAIIPKAPGNDLNVGLLFLLGVVAIDIIGLLMAGWGSANKYALIGSARSVNQIVAYEVPAALALLSGVMMLGTLSIQAISARQGIYSDLDSFFLGIWNVTETGGILGWAVIRYPHLLIAFAVYFIASLAESNRAPFDLPEAESELVSGFHVEYSGFRFALVMLSEYGKMLITSILAVTVFLGGWNTILPNIHVGETSLLLASWTSGEPGTVIGALWGAFWILSKSMLLVLLQIYIRWTYPRVRIDQLMTISWKYLTPIAFGLFILSGLWKLAEVYGQL